MNGSAAGRALEKDGKKIKKEKGKAKCFPRVRAMQPCAVPPDLHTYQERAIALRLLLTYDIRRVLSFAPQSGRNASALWSPLADVLGKTSLSFFFPSATMHEEIGRRKTTKKKTT